MVGVDAKQQAAYFSDPRMYQGHSPPQQQAPGETNRYTVLSLIGKGSYGVVCAAKDNLTGELVAIKKIQNVFDNVADAIRILREITLLRLLKHPDMVDIKHIMLPSDPTTYKDLYVVFELMESDLHMVIGANRDLTPDHHKVFLFQLLRGINYMHLSGVLHRDLKPKNILVNSNCKLKVCDLGLARPYVAGQQPLTPVMWTEYVATRWYRAPELCGQFYGKYTGAVDIWSVGCIFAEVLLGKPLFPGRDLVHQLQLITDLLGKPPPHVISAIHNARARAFLATMPNKEPRPFASKFPGIDPPALELLARMLSFDPADRPTAEEALAHPYFSGMPSGLQQQADPVAPHFEFERYQASLTEADVRHLIYREALHYHPEVREVYMRQAVRSRNPYPLVSTPSESVSLQFMLQSDSGDSSSFCDPLSSETCTSHSVMQQQHHNHQQQQRYNQQQQQHHRGGYVQQQYSGSQQRPTSGGSSASVAPGSAAQHAAAAVGSALSSALLQPADPSTMGAAAAAAAGYGLGTVSASSKAPWDPPAVAQNGYVPCAYPHHPPGHLYSQPSGYSAQQHQAAVLQQYHQALPAALANAVGAANIGRCIPEPLGGGAYPSATHATS